LIGHRAFPGLISCWLARPAEFATARTASEHTRRRGFSVIAALLPCRAEAIFAQHLPSGLLNRLPRCPLPGGPRRARRGVLHAACEVGCTPTPVVVASELEVVALARHAHGEVPDATPRVEPTMHCQEDWR